MRFHRADGFNSNPIREVFMFRPFFIALLASLLFSVGCSGSVETCGDCEMPDSGRTNLARMDVRIPETGGDAGIPDPMDAKGEPDAFVDPTDVSDVPMLLVASDGGDADARTGPEPLC